ncbi:MAG: hypothetical protein ACXVAB_11635 [Thermodesulfobacteriota bacterium]
MKYKFKKDIQAIGHSQDYANTQSQTEIHTPVKEWKNDQVKLFGPQYAEELGRDSEPGNTGLQLCD